MTRSQSGSTVGNVSPYESKRSQFGSTLASHSLSISFNLEEINIWQRGMKGLERGGWEVESVGEEEWKIWVFSERDEKGGWEVESVSWGWGRKNCLGFRVYFFNFHIVRLLIVGRFG